MLFAGMLFAVLVLGPLFILAAMAVASNERAVAWLRQVTGQARGGDASDGRPLDIAPEPAADTPPAAPADIVDTADAAPGSTQQSA